MRSRPVVQAGRASLRTRPAARSTRRRIGRLLLWLLAFVLLIPPALVMAYRFVPPLVTPLMVIRLIQGQGLRKDWVPLGKISPALPQAVVAAEDNLFCEHSGFDWRSLRGEIDAWLAGERARGASTITMQTAKNLFFWPDRSLLRKALEAWITPQIELLWPKRRIVEVYLNIVEFGPGVYGAEAAAREYFGKPASDLDAQEAALLAAVLPKPLEWSPARPTDFLSRRARTIQRRIRQLGPMLACVEGA
jgi:monofunctional biosynthetic peptidoglycan transglycosylase